MLEKKRGGTYSRLTANHDHKGLKFGFGIVHVMHKPLVVHARKQVVLFSGFVVSSPCQLIRRRNFKGLPRIILRLGEEHPAGAYRGLKQHTACWRLDGHIVALAHRLWVQRARRAKQLVQIDGHDRLEQPVVKWHLLLVQLSFGLRPHGQKQHQVQPEQQRLKVGRTCFASFAKACGVYGEQVLALAAI